MAENETFLEGKKAQIAEQKRLFRDAQSKDLALKLLEISGTNFLITPQQSRIILTLEAAGLELNSHHPQNPDGSASSEWGWTHALCDACKRHQLGSGEPDNYRSQFLKALKAAAAPGGNPETPKKSNWLGF
jgi:hypothetical protein